MRKACLRAISSYLPPGRLTNEDLAVEFGGWDAAKILEKTGIAERPIAGTGECSSDLAVEAARKLFRSGGCSPNDVDFLLFCTQSPDYFLPASACLIQERLGLSTRVGALDFNQGCSGFVYGLALAKGLVESGAADTVLLLTGETYSKFIHPKDKSTRTIFGDAAAAAVVTWCESDRELLGPFVFGTDGAGAENLIVPVGGLRRRPGPAPEVESTDGAGSVRSDANLFMNGPEIFSFTLRVVPATFSRLLAAWGGGQEDVDIFFFHQANRFMLEKLRAKLRVPPEKFWLDLERTGNTVSTTIPYAMESARERGTLKPGHRAMLVGFGVGYSWAACMHEEC